MSGDIVVEENVAVCLHSPVKTAETLHFLIALSGV